jgi:hypothetical protein
MRSSVFVFVECKMKKNKIIELKIGDKLYSYVMLKGVFSYDVIGVREYVDVKLYEIECNMCSGHKQCKLLVSQNDNETSFKYISMIDEDENNEQYYWHSESSFFTTSKECKRKYLKKLIEEKKKDIEKTKELVKYKEEELNKLNLFFSEAQ